MIPLLLGSAAHASSFGVGAAVVKDLPDAVDTSVPTRFGVGGALLFPVRYDLAPAAALRGTVRFDASKGSDEVTWQLGDQRVGESPKWAVFLSSALTVGPEIRFPVEGTVRPYAAGELGVALVHTFHNIERPELIPEEFRTDTGSLDPFSRQPAFVTDLAIGVHLGRVAGSAGLGPAWVELGYTNLFLDAVPLRRSVEELEVERAAYAWNALRLAVGVAVSFGGTG